VKHCSTLTHAAVPHPPTPDTAGDVSVNGDNVISALAPWVLLQNLSQNNLTISKQKKLLRSVQSIPDVPRGHLWSWVNFALKGIFCPCKFCNSITCESIVLESCSNPKRLGESSSLRRKKILNFNLRGFVGDVITGLRLGLYGQGYRSLGPNRKSEVFRSGFQCKLS